MSLHIRDWFDERIKHIKCDEKTRAYIVGVYSEQVFVSKDLSDQSIVLLYHNADGFQTYQSIGDWVLWLGTFCEPAFKKHETVYESFARLSYYRCYELLNRQWKVYEELADDLPRILGESRKILQSKFPEDRGISDRYGTRR